MVDTSYTPDTEQPSGNVALSIARMLWKRRWTALAIWVMLGVVALLVSSALPPVYRAEAVVMANSQKIPENFVSPTVSGDITDRLAMISQRIMTSARLLTIINAFDLYRDARKRLTQQELIEKMRSDISVSFEKDWTGERTKSFRLGYQGRNPKVVAEVANRLAGLYVAENTRSREDQAAGTVEFLKRQLREAKASLDEQEEKVAQFKQQHNGTLPEQENSLLATLGSLNGELEATQTSMARAQESKFSLQAALTAAESSDATLRSNLHRELKGLGQDGVITPNSASLKERLRVLEEKYTPNHPDVQALKRELADMEREESEENAAAMLHKPAAQKDATPIESSPELVQSKERIAGLRAQIEVSEHQLQLLEKQRQQLSAAIADCQARISRLPLVEQEMAALKRNYDESANNYNSLLQKTLAAGVATDMERSQKSEQFTVIDPARPPDKPEKSKRLAIAAGGIVGGLVLGLLTGFLLEFRKQQLLGEWELPLGTVVLGRVPLIESRPVSRIAATALLLAFLVGVAVHVPALSQMVKM